MKCHMSWCTECAVVLWMPPANLSHLPQRWVPTCEPHSRGIRRLQIGRFRPVFPGHNPGHSPSGAGS